MENGNGCFVHALHDDNSTACTLAYNPCWMFDIYLPSSSSQYNLERGANIFRGGTCYFNFKRKKQIG
eukprot:gnl/Chilomastix_caulleri/2105.p1 GENE.gnl/Chilomastix_caulleri/2105~~gnl/Chilomastix_caulleri/2105.p1  ORF type:complete len:67 (+),score=11.79 gnl/Chilomastix_caulleri/2105:53-253(+)